MGSTAKNVSALVISIFCLTVFRGASTLVSAQREAVEPVAQNSSIDAVERQRVISGAAANLKRHYFDRDVAQRTADALLAHEKSGDDDAATDGKAFADLLTKQMRETSQDRHLSMEYSQRPLPEGHHRRQPMASRAFAMRCYSKTA